MDVDVRLNGPWFDGSAERTIGAFLNEAKNDVADRGVNLMHESTWHFKHPTGYWESQIQTDRQADDIVIHDDVVYNAWLEGVSSRNKTTRFKGYRIWRLAGQHLQALAPEIAQRTLSRFIGRLGG